MAASVEITEEIDDAGTTSAEAERYLQSIPAKTKHVSGVGPLKREKVFMKMVVRGRGVSLPRYRAYIYLTCLVSRCQACSVDAGSRL